MESKSKHTYQVNEAQKIQERGNTGGQYCATLRRLIERERYILKYQNNLNYPNTVLTLIFKST